MSDVLGLQWKLTQARNENQENRARGYSGTVTVTTITAVLTTNLGLHP